LNKTLCSSFLLGVTELLQNMAVKIVKKLQNVVLLVFDIRPETK